MNPEYIVIVVEENHIICATFAYSMVEAEIIANNYTSTDTSIKIVPVDYSMRGE